MNSKVAFMLIIILTVTTWSFWHDSQIPATHALSSDHLIAHWNFNDDHNAPLTHDLSSHANDATIFGATVDTGLDLYGLYFDGNDYVEVSSTDFNLQTAVTLTAWVNPSRLSGYTRIAGKTHTSDTNPWVIYGLTINPEGYALFELASNTARGWAKSTTTIPLNTWTHIAGTYDGRWVTLYINGQHASTSAFSGRLRRNAAPFSIGRSSYEKDYFHGCIDEVRVYSRALTALEIEGTLYSQLHCLELNTPSELGLDLVFLPEDYSIEELPLFRASVEDYAAAFFAFDLFAEYRDRINIWRIDALMDFGAHHARVGHGALWRINSYKARNFVQSLIELDLDHDFPSDQIIVLVNNHTRGGAGYPNVGVTYTGSIGAQVMIHEFGHSFGRLGDEYILYDDDYHGQSIPYPNIDWDGSKWADIPGTGAYTGAWYQNLVRPALQCRMRSSTYAHFCPVCELTLRSSFEHFSPVDRKQPVLEVTSDKDSGAPGSTIQYRIHITNRDYTFFGPSTFSFSAIMPPGWIATFSHPLLTVTPGTTNRSCILSITSPHSSSEQSYTIYVTAENDHAHGYSGTAAAQYVVLANQSPIAHAGGPYTVTEGIPLVLMGANSYDPDGTILQYQWDFGDGATGSGVTVTHRYTNNGTYHLRLTVIDEQGANSSQSSLVTVIDTGPTASFRATPREGPPVLNVTFVDTSSSYDGFATWLWDFGDGQMSTQQHPVHHYTMLGHYTVTLTITEQDGDSDRISIPITVYDRTPPTITVTVAPLKPDVTQQIQITVRCDDLSGIESLHLYVDDQPVRTRTTDGPHIYSLEPLTEGAHSYYVEAIDRAGNTGRDPLTGVKSFTVHPYPMDWYWLILAFAAVAGLLSLVVFVGKR